MFPMKSNTLCLRLQRAPHSEASSVQSVLLFSLNNKHIFVLASFFSSFLIFGTTFNLNNLIKDDFMFSAFELFNKVYGGVGEENIVQRKCMKCANLYGTHFLLWALNDLGIEPTVTHLIGWSVQISRSFNATVLTSQRSNTHCERCWNTA